MDDDGKARRWRPSDAVRPHLVYWLFLSRSGLLVHSGAGDGSGRVTGAQVTAAAVQVNNGIGTKDSGPPIPKGEREWERKRKMRALSAGCGGSPAANGAPARTLEATAESNRN